MLVTVTINHTAQWQCNDSIAPFQAHRYPFLLITTNILPVNVISLCVSSFTLCLWNSERSCNYDVEYIIDRVMICFH